MSSLLDEINEERAAKLDKIRRRAFTIPTRDRVVAVFEPLRNLEQIVDLAERADDNLTLVATRLAEMCVGVDLLTKDGRRVPLTDELGPVRLDHRLAAALKAPPAHTDWSTKDLLLWLVDGRPDALADWGTLVYRWASASSREVDDELVGESRAGPPSTPSPEPAR